MLKLSGKLKNKRKENIQDGFLKSQYLLFPFVIKNGSEKGYIDFIVPEQLFTH